MNGATILVADDDRAIRVVLDQALGRLGYQVRSTDKAATLWQWIGEGQGDLVITDVVMPELDGRTLGHRLRDRFPSLPVLYISAFPPDDLFHRGAPDQNAPFLQKPIDEADLLQTVERLLTGNQKPALRR